MRTWLLTFSLFSVSSNYFISLFFSSISLFFSSKSLFFSSISLFRSPPLSFSHLSISFVIFLSLSLFLCAIFIFPTLSLSSAFFQITYVHINKKFPLHCPCVNYRVISQKYMQLKLFLYCFFFIEKRVSQKHFYKKVLFN